MSNSSISQFYSAKLEKRKISMVTCYDFWSAKLINESNIDTILVGDSLSMVMHGYPTTLNADVDLMCLHSSAVVKGAPNKFIIGDLPFLSYRKSLSENMNAIEKIMKTGVHAVKLEGAQGNLDLIKHIVDSGVPVMGHLGLTPQSINQLGGFKVQGKTTDSYDKILTEAQQLENAGCFCLVLECVPTLLGKEITEKLSIPTIGIGAGPHTDGQVLVLQDMLGLSLNFKPKFLRTYLDGSNLIKNALNSFNTDVKENTFPSIEESYS